MGLDYPNFEVIVVDNRRDPRSPFPDLAKDDRVRVIREVGRGASQARNCGIAHAMGEFVAFTDDDVVVDVNWLRDLGATFLQNPAVDGISGLALPLELRTPPQLWFEEFFGGFNKSFTTELISTELLAAVDEMFPYSTGRFGAGCNMAFRSSALVTKGGFDPVLGAGTLARGGEDLALCMKQVLTGGTLIYEPRAIVRHRHRESEREFLSQVFGYGVGLTAMFTSLIVHDPRHAWRMIRRVPGGYRLLTTPRDERSPSLNPSYPFRTYARHWSGLAYGPLAYARSAIHHAWLGRGPK